MHVDPKLASPSRPNSTRDAVAATPAGEAAAHRNEVTICGRLSSYPDHRELPNGEQLVSWRLVVDRPGVGGGVDVIDCVARPPQLRQAALSWEPGMVIAVEGALRRRFWRTGAGTAGRYEVETTSARPA